MLLTYLRRPVGRMTITEQKLEGEYRYINSRLITNAEEIAFYNGNYREKLTILASFEKLVTISLCNVYPFCHPSNDNENETVACVEVFQASMVNILGYGKVESTD